MTWHRHFLLSDPPDSAMQNASAALSDLTTTTYTIPTSQHIQRATTALTTTPDVFSCKHRTAFGTIFVLFRIPCLSKLGADGPRRPGGALHYGSCAGAEARRGFEAKANLKLSSPHGRYFEKTMYSRSLSLILWFDGSCLFGKFWCDGGALTKSAFRKTPELPTRDDSEKMPGTQS